MCFISVVMQEGARTWPGPQTGPQTVPIDNLPIAVLPSPEQWQAFQELCEKARKFDEITGQPDCEDPEKAAWMKRIEDRLRAAGI